MLYSVPKSRTFLSIFWKANNKKLVYKLLDKLKKNDTIRRNIWPKKYKKNSSHKKVFHPKNLAQKLFKDIDTIKNVLNKNNASTHYGMAIKNQLSYMKKI